MREDQDLGLRRLTLQNHLLRLQLLPDVGGKIISLVYLPSGFDVIFQPPEPAKGYKVPGYGTQFKDFDNSGFDECIPTVGACRYPGPAPSSGAPQIDLPDHGEVWSVPWQVQERGSSLDMQCRGRQLAYVFRKSLRLEGNALIIDYGVENLSSSAITYLWSSHPLLNVSPGDRILIPPQVKEVFIDQSHSGRLGGFGNRCAWPIATLEDGSTADLSQLGPPSTGAAEKYFTPPLRQGWCALESPRAALRLTFRFDPTLVPFLGLWINQGGWPRDKARKDYTIAIEPCSGAPDSLENAVKFHQAQRLEPNSTQTWSLRLELEALGGNSKP